MSVRQAIQDSPKGRTRLLEALSKSDLPVSQDSHRCPKPQVKAQELLTRREAQRATEASRRDEINASHHGDMPQNAALTCANVCDSARSRPEGSKMCSYSRNNVGNSRMASQNRRSGEVPVWPPRRRSHSQVGK